MAAIKTMLFGLILLILLLSAVAKPLLDIYSLTIMPLKGHIEYSEKPVFKWDAWFDGTYQAELDPYLEDNVAFRNFLVRLFNQTDFSLFRIVHADEVIPGRDNYLYEQNYVDAYTGKNFRGHEFIEEKCRKLKVVQDELKKLDIEILVVLAPGKASFFPEYIPDEYLKERGPSNNQAYLGSFMDKNINHIDFNRYFLLMKDTAEHVLIPKCGIHWSSYASNIAYDSLISYIEHVMDIDMVDISYEGIEISSIPRSTDYDIGDALNLLWRIPSRPLAYPYNYSWVEEGKDKPNIMVIGDSYYWSFFNKPYHFKLWRKHDFRYYNKLLFESYLTKKDALQIDQEYLLKFDFIMLMYTEASMHFFANDFIDHAYYALTSED